MADHGSYVLIVDCDSPVDIEVGALGEIIFDGAYAYVGSAFGPGGLSRVDRHQELAAGDRDTRHWHIDYLLGADSTGLAAVETYPERDIECALATALREAGCEPVAAFGASDCDCRSHLWGADTASTLRRIVRSNRG
jgi:Uri superfamily endonuclease